MTEFEIYLQWLSDNWSLFDNKDPVEVISIDDSSQFKI
jgi:hypothetical protein